MTDSPDTPRVPHLTFDPEPRLHVTWVDHVAQVWTSLGHVTGQGRPIGVTSALDNGKLGNKAL